MRAMTSDSNKVAKDVPPYFKEARHFDMSPELTRIAFNRTELTRKKISYPKFAPDIGDQDGPGRRLILRVFRRIGANIFVPTRPVDQCETSTF